MTQIMQKWEKLDPQLRQWLSSPFCLRQTMHDLLQLNFDELSQALKADEVIQVHTARSTTIGQGLSSSLPTWFYWRDTARSGSARPPDESCCSRCDGAFEPLEMRDLSEAPSTAPAQIPAPPAAVQTEALRRDLGARLAQWRIKQHSTSQYSSYLSEHTVMDDETIFALSERAPRILTQHLSNKTIDARYTSLLLGTKSGLSSVLIDDLAALLAAWAREHTDDAVGSLLTPAGRIRKSTGTTQPSTNAKEEALLDPDTVG